MVNAAKNYGATLMQIGRKSRLCVSLCNMYMAVQKKSVCFYEITVNITWCAFFGVLE